MKKKKNPRESRMQANVFTAQVGQNHKLVQQKMTQTEAKFKL